MKSTLLFLFLLIFIKSYAQVKLKGTIDAKGASVENIHVSNLTNENFTISKADGTFDIDANEDDILTFHAIHLEFWRQSVKAKDIACACLRIQMTPKVYELEGVEVTEYTKINAVTLGIVSPNIIRRTQAERRLYTATSGGGLIALDPIINAITGRTRMLKNELAIEQLERLESKVFESLESDFFSSNLNIHPDYHIGFVRLVIHDVLVEQAIQKNEIERLKFLLKDQAIFFLKNKPEAIFKN